MTVLIKIFEDDAESPTNPAELVVCDENENVIYFSDSEEADLYRDQYAINSIIVEL